MVTSLLAVAVSLAAPGSARPQAPCAERLLPPPPAAAAGKRDPEPRDLIELRDFGGMAESPSAPDMFALSPDGRMIAVALRRASVAANGYCYGLLVVPLDGGPARLIDVGGEPLMMAFDLREQADFPNGVVMSSPLAWSPDGRWIAYLRRDDGRTRLWRARADGSGAKPVQTGDEDVRSFAWDGDGALTFSVRAGLAEAVAKREAEGEDGYHYDDRFEPQASAAPGLPVSMPMVRKRIDLVTGMVGQVGASAGPAVRAADGPQGARSWIEPRWSERYYPGSRMRVRVGQREIACSGAACLDRIIGMWWRKDGSLLFLHDRSMPGGGRLALYAWRPGHGEPRLQFVTDDLLADCRLVGDVSLLCTSEGPTQPRRIVRIAVADGQGQPVFDPNPEWAGLRAGSVEHLEVAADDGARTYARVLLPPSHRPGERHPLVVVQYQSRGFLRGGTGDEVPMAVLAARGYAVLSFQKTLSPAMESDAKDFESFRRISVQGWRDRRRINTALLAAIDAAIEGGFADPKRIGITGLSDGSVSTAFALLNNRGRHFRAAIMGTCCEDPAIRFATGPAFLASIVASGYPAPGRDDPAFWRGYSLAASVDHVETPLLIQAADSEFRLSLEAFATLREARVPVELYVFPGEYHIKWQPRHRDAVYRRVIAWLDFWLRDRPDPDRVEEMARWKKLRVEWSGSRMP